jgi:hypothetical protein
MGQYGRVGVRMSEADAEVDDPAAAGCLSDQLGVVAGVGHGGHGLNEGVEERAAAHIGQLAAVVELPEHGHRVGRLVPVGQPEHGSPDGSVGGPVEVGLLEHGGDLVQQPSGRQDGAEDGLFGFLVVGRLLVGFGHWPQPSPGGLLARLGWGHRRGLRGALPRRRCGWRGGVVGRWVSRICLT